jgi:hypothetical protein
METESGMMDKEVEKRFGLIKDWVQNKVQKAFPDATFDSREEKWKCYKLRIDLGARPLCWLIFTWECLSNQNDRKIIDALERENVFDGLSKASEPMRIWVIETDAKEVGVVYEKMQVE